MDYKQFYGEHLSRIEHVIDFVVRRRQLSATEGEDFRSTVHLRIIEHDYAILRKFQGRSNLNTYLTTVVERLFLDYCNARWGKWRASALAQKRGPAAVALERLIGRDGLPASEAIELLLTNGQVMATRAELEAVARELPARVNRKAGADDELALVESAGPSADAGIATQEKRSLAEQVQRALKAALGQLTSDDRLILQFRFVRGLQVAAIARLLGSDQKALYRRQEALMRQLRAALIAEGIDPVQVDELVGHAEVVVEGVF